MNKQSLKSHLIRLLNHLLTGMLVYVLSIAPVEASLLLGQTDERRTN